MALRAHIRFTRLVGGKYDSVAIDPLYLFLQQYLIGAVGYPSAGEYPYAGTGRELASSSWRAS